MSLCLERLARRVELTKVKTLLKRETLLNRGRISDPLLRKVLQLGMLSMFMLITNNFKQIKLLTRALSTVRFILTSKLSKERRGNNMFKHEKHYEVISALVSRFNLDVCNFIFNACLQSNPITIKIYNAAIATSLKRHYITNLIINHLNEIGRKRVVLLRYVHFLSSNRLRNICLTKTNLNSILLTTGFVELLIKIHLRTIQLSRTLSNPRFSLE